MEYDHKQSEDDVQGIFFADFFVDFCFFSLVLRSDTAYSSSYPFHSHRGEPVRSRGRECNAISVRVLYYRMWGATFLLAPRTLIHPPDHWGALGSN